MEAARAARADELVLLGQLAQLAVAEAERRRGGAALVGRWTERSVGAWAEALGAYLTAEDRRLLAGTLDTAVVGVAAVRGPAAGCGSLDLLFVEPEARGVGVGERLLDEVTGWLGRRGCTGLDAVALPGDRGTKQFFESASMTARLLIMHRSL